MTKMDLMTRELANTLGEDTADLKMRVGLHSGSVTAGVLRGYVWNGTSYCMQVLENILLILLLIIQLGCFY